MSPSPARTIAGPWISVVIPAFNAENHLEAAIDSVLGQTTSPLELIVVDDGSEDDTAAIAGSYGHRVRLERQPNGGVSRARNRGIALARARYVAFLDADDVWLPEKIETQLALATRYPQLGCVYTGYQRVDAGLRKVGPPVIVEQEDAVIRTLLLEPPGIWVSSTCLFPRRVLDEVGGFDEGLSTSADVDLAVRVGLRYPVAGVPRALVLYRQHASQMHLNVDAMARDMCSIYRRVFDAPEAQDIAHLRTRAWANLEATLALGYARERRYGEAARRFTRAFSVDPRRATELFAAAVSRRSTRLRRTLRSKTHGE